LPKTLTLMKPTDLSATAHSVHRETQLADLHVLVDVPQNRVLRQAARADELVDVDVVSPSVDWCW
jgi:hypothetical protein